MRGPTTVGKPRLFANNLFMLAEIVIPGDHRPPGTFMDTRDMSQITKLHEPWVALATGVYQHKKRGTTYIIVGLGVIQLPRKTAESRPLVRDDDRLIINKTAVPGLLHCTGPEMSESTHAVSGARVQCEEPLQHGEIVFVYVDIDSGEYSVRRVAEFLDGRFEKVA